MMARGETSVNVGTAGVAVAAGSVAFSQTPGSLAARDKSASRIPFAAAGMLFSPAESLAWLLGLLAASACIAPWFAHGWLWLELVSVVAAFFVGYDALMLWLARQEFAPVLIMPEKGLRGREGQTIPLPLALRGSGLRQRRSQVRVAIMPAAPEGDTATQIKTEPQRLTLERPSSTAAPSAGSAPLLLWSWTPQIALLRRGVWPGPRVGLERLSHFGIWRLRKWFDFPERLRIDADLRSGRREMLRSPVYRALVASRQTPWTGHGRDFERLREYQPGDTYSEIAWKSTARRSAPVTRLFQWEQKQEVYFVVDQSRASALPLDPAGEIESENSASRPAATKRLLDLAVETALVGATVALELGDDFGLVTYADEPKSWLRAGSGQAQFHRFRDRLLGLEPLPTTADYELLFGEIRLRLRRRAYLVLLADLTERSLSDSLCRGLGLVRSSHAVLVTSILPANARPAFSPGDDPQTDKDVYAVLAGERENQRLAAFARRLHRLDVQLRFVPSETFLRAAVEGYLESKREQRL